MPLGVQFSFVVKIALWFQTPPPHQEQMFFVSKNALYWHGLFVLSRARLDHCTHLRQVELAPIGRGRACGEGLVLSAAPAHMAGNTSCDDVFERCTVMRPPLVYCTSYLFW